MNCVHSFSPTPLTEERPETGKELQIKFIKGLTGKEKNAYMEYVIKSTLLTKKRDDQINILKGKFIDIMEKYIQFIDVNKSKTLSVKEKNRYYEYNKKLHNIKETYQKQLDVLKENYESNLSEEQKEYRRWLFDDRFMDDTPAAFSRKWAKRWVCKQVYEMGWKKELFEEFEKDHVF